MFAAVKSNLKNIDLIIMTAAVKILNQLKQFQIQKSKKKTKILLYLNLKKALIYLLISEKK